MKTPLTSNAGRLLSVETREKLLFSTCRCSGKTQLGAGRHCKAVASRLTPPRCLPALLPPAVQAVHDAYDRKWCSRWPSSGRPRERYGTRDRTSVCVTRQSTPDKSHKLFTLYVCGSVRVRIWLQFSLARARLRSLPSRFSCSSVCGNVTHRKPQH